MEWSNSKYEHREERDDESPMREQYDDLQQDGTVRSIIPLDFVQVNRETSYRWGFAEASLKHQAPTR